MRRNQIQHMNHIYIEKISSTATKSLSTTRKYPVTHKTHTQKQSD